MDYKISFFFLSVWLCELKEGAELLDDQYTCFFSKSECPDSLCSLNLTHWHEKLCWKCGSFLYSTRLKMVMANSGKQNSFKMAFPNGITAPQPVLAAPPISPAEIQLVSVYWRNCIGFSNTSKMLQRCIRVCNCCVKHCTTTYEPHNEWLNDNCFNFLFNFHTRIYMFTGMQDTWYIFPIVSTTPHTPHSNSNNRYFLYSAILPEKLIRCALHIHTSSDDHHGVHLYNAVTPCYCSMLGAFSRLVSFGACC